MDKKIIQTIIEHLLYTTDDDEGTTIEAIQKEKLIGFEPIHNENDETQYYQAIVPNSFQYDAVIKTIAKGLSFRQTTDVYEEYQDMTGMTSKMGNINRRKVTMLVQIFCAESLQRIAEAMKYYWVFAIALDGGNQASVPYLDIRICFVLGHELFNVHLIACPMYESHTGDNMFDVTTKILDVLGPSWKDKVIGDTTNGASNMTGCHVGMGTQIQ